MATPGYYSNVLTKYGIKTEATATQRVGLSRFTFPEGESHILLNLGEGLTNETGATVRFVSDTEIEGYATYSNAFTGYSLEQNYTLYFVLQFSKPFDSMGGWVNDGVQPVTGYIPGWNRTHRFDTPAEIRQDIDSISGRGDLGVFLNYRTEEGEAILVRSGVSLVDMAGARNNLQQELTTPFGWDFERVVAHAREVWNDYLGRVEIETDDYLQKKKFVISDDDTYLPAIALCKYYKEKRQFREFRRICDALLAANDEVGDD